MKHGEEYRMQMELAREVIGIAKSFLQELEPAAKNDVRLEQIEDRGDEWSVVLSYPINNPLYPFMGTTDNRVYKQLLVGSIDLIGGGGNGKEVKSLLAWRP